MAEEIPDLHPFHAEVLKLLRSLVTHPEADPAAERGRLRDRFAGQALAGWLANPNNKAHPVSADEWAIGVGQISTCADSEAREAYALADAMLKAREGK